MASELASATLEWETLIPRPIDTVWQALVSQTEHWWPKDFHTSELARRFVIEPVLGGRVFEDFGDGNGLVWYTVIGMQAGRELTLAGQLFPPFGGPALTGLRITLSPQDEGTLLRLQDFRTGSISNNAVLEGWKQVFENGLRNYLETIVKQLPQLT
jgi:uncharacterized protein YndB with AHSA1/START domain